MISDRSTSSDRTFDAFILLICFVLLVAVAILAIRTGRGDAWFATVFLGITTGLRLRKHLKGRLL